MSKVLIIEDEINTAKPFYVQYRQRKVEIRNTQT